MDHEPWQSSSILADDIACVELSAADLAIRSDFQMSVILTAIVEETQHWQLHPKVRELWIRKIEGNDPTDDVWLWMEMKSGLESTLTLSVCLVIGSLKMIGWMHSQRTSAY